MVANVEVSGGPGGGGRRSVAADHELDAEERVCVAYDSFGQREVEVDSNEG